MCNITADKPIPYTCNGIYLPSTPCAEAWSLMHTRPRLARARYDACARQGDPFAAYGAVTLAFFERLGDPAAVASYRADMELAIRTGFGDCAMCYVLAERDLGLSYVTNSPIDLSRGQLHLLKACRHRSSEPAVGYRIADGLEPCELMNRTAAQPDYDLYVVSVRRLCTGPQEDADE